jgi:hypothetical protein
MFEVADAGVSVPWSKVGSCWDVNITTNVCQPSTWRPTQLACTLQTQFLRVIPAVLAVCLSKARKNCEKADHTLKWDLTHPYFSADLILFEMVHLAMRCALGAHRAALRICRFKNQYFLFEGCRNYSCFCWHHVNFS